MAATPKWTTVLAAFLLAASVGVIAAPAGHASASAGRHPVGQHLVGRHSVEKCRTLVSLPDGYMAEGIAVNRRTATFYADSHANGDIYRGSLISGRGGLLVRDTAVGEQAYGVGIDGRDRLWVAYGASGQLRVFDPSSGRRLATYQVGAPGTGLVNDLLVTRNAVYATDSVAQRMYVVPLPGNGRLPDSRVARVVPLVGDIRYSPTGKYGLPFNGNGIETTPDGRALLIDQTNAGKLFRVDPRTGRTKEVPLAGGDIAFADGLRRIGRTLYVAQNDSGHVAEIVLSRDGASGRIVGHPTGQRAYLRPASLAVFCGRMYVSQMIDLQPYATADWIDSFRIGA